VTRNGKYRLQVGDGLEKMPSNGMLSDLLSWARRLGLLRGQRNRTIEKAIARLRNHVAHPSAYHLTTPVDAANTISDLAEIINHLWGSATPGGRLYPAPVERGIVAVMCDGKTGAVMSASVAAETASARGEVSLGGPDPRDWTWVLVRGGGHDLGPEPLRRQVRDLPVSRRVALGSRPRPCCTWLDQPPRRPRGTPSAPRWQVRCRRSTRRRKYIPTSKEIVASQNLKITSWHNYENRFASLSVCAGRRPEGSLLSSPGRAG
jgi:hypothetical protein